MTRRTAVRAGSAGSDRTVPVDSALWRCLAIDPDRFATEHWARRPLLRRAAERSTAASEAAAAVGDGTAGFAELLSVEAVDELLSRRGLRTPFLRAARNGTVLDQRQYTGGGGAGAEVGDQVLDERVLRVLVDGGTLVLQGLHRTWPPLIDFATRLADELRHPVQVNAYLTPADNRGFASHYDTHDVFVLQVAGRKRWLVHEPVLADPLPIQPWGGRADEVAATAAGTPVLDVVLAPGDAMYLPRGWLHQAEAQGELSLHLTIGIHTITRYALVEALLGLATTDPELRRSLPVGIEVADPDELAGPLADTVTALARWLDTADPAEVAERLRQRYWPASRPAPIRPIAQAAAAESVTPQTAVRRRGGLRWRLRPLGASAGKVALDLFDRTITFPASCGPALRAVLCDGVHQVKDLPGLDPDDQLVLARRLLREAIVVTLEG